MLSSVAVVVVAVCGAYENVSAEVAQWVEWGFSCGWLCRGSVLIGDARPSCAEAHGLINCPSDWSSLASAWAVAAPQLIKVAIESSVAVVFFIFVVAVLIFTICRRVTLCLHSSSMATLRCWDSLRGPPRQHVDGCLDCVGSGVDVNGQMKIAGEKIPSNLLPLLYFGTGLQRKGN